MMAKATGGRLANMYLRYGSDYEDELPAHDRNEEYLPHDFVSLFDANDSDRPECLSTWLPCLPPLALELHKLADADLSVDAKAIRVVQAIEQGMDVVAIDPRYGRSVLHWACMLADAELVASLLSRGANAQVNLTDHQGNTALACVVAFRHLPGSSQVIEALLSDGASLDMLGHKGAELLYAKDLTLTLAEKLLRTQVNVNGRKDCDVTPFLAAVRRGDWAIASVLLRHGADICIFGPLRTTVLHNPRIPIWLAEQLHQRGADVNAKDMQGETPLMMACAEGNIALVQWLLGKGARCGETSIDNQTLADYARVGGAEMTGWLVRNGYVVLDAPAES